MLNTGVLSRIYMKGGFLEMRRMECNPESSVSGRVIAKFPIVSDKFSWWKNCVTLCCVLGGANLSKERVDSGLVVLLSCVVQGLVRVSIICKISIKIHLKLWIKLHTMCGWWGINCGVCISTLWLEPQRGRRVKLFVFIVGQTQSFLIDNQHTSFNTYSSSSGWGCERVELSWGE